VRSGALGECGGSRAGRAEGGELATMQLGEVGTVDGGAFGHGLIVHNRRPPAEGVV
jgi:hypothetical protein